MALGSRELAGRNEKGRTWGALCGSLMDEVVDRRREEDTVERAQDAKRTKG